VLSASVVSTGVIRPSAYDDSALAALLVIAATAMTSRAGRAWWIRSGTGPVPKTARIACAVAVSWTAAPTPMPNWQPASSSTALRSMAQAIRAVRASTDGSRLTMAVNAASSSGFLPYLPP
jgi:hypothetical protein